jgi:hypothetical protein
MFREERKEVGQLVSFYKSYHICSYIHIYYYIPQEREIRRLEHEERRIEHHERRDEFGGEPGFRHEERHHHREEEREIHREEREIRREEREFNHQDQIASAPIVAVAVAASTNAPPSQQNGQMVAFFNLEHKHFMHAAENGDSDCKAKDSGEGSQWLMIRGGDHEAQFKCIRSGHFLCIDEHGTFHSRGRQEDPYTRFRVESLPNGSILIQCINTGEFLGASMMGHLKQFPDGRSHERCQWKVEMMQAF